MKRGNQPQGFQDCQGGGATKTLRRLSKADGLAALSRFVQALAIYGPDNPFLYPMYGVGDIGQAYARLAHSDKLGTENLVRRCVALLVNRIEHFLPSARAKIDELLGAKQAELEVLDHDLMSVGADASRALELTQQREALQASVEGLYEQWEELEALLLEPQSA